MAKYQGHDSWACWNVALWMSNDEGLYRMALDEVQHSRTKDDAAENILDALHEMGMTHTPDGAKFTKTNIRKALVGL